MYQALYRKWRPRTFDEVVGQEHVTETLKRQVMDGRTSHAYLFTGTRGTGKTTDAKILARAVNCLHPVNGNPCNCCEVCLGIENGTILDVAELDAASNNKVDNVRALLEEAVYTPATTKKRVYIVDEVHMLTPQAFNALLQILEEPPSHLMFILATTELQKVPATIKSRCQQFSFKRIPANKIADRLLYVAEQEKIQLTEDGAGIIARLADGGLRDALSLLDQCAALAGPEGILSANVVLNTLGLAGNIETVGILDDVAAGNTASALERVGKLYSAGKEMAALASELSTLVRDLLVFRTAPQAADALMTGGHDRDTLERLSQAFEPTRLVQMLALIQSTAADLSRSSNRRTDMELCIISMCNPAIDSSLAGLANRVSKLEKGIRVGGVAPAPQIQPQSYQPQRQQYMPQQPPAPAPQQQSAPPPRPAPAYQPTPAPAASPAPAPRPQAQAPAPQPVRTQVQLKPQPQAQQPPVQPSAAQPQQTPQWPGWDVFAQKLTVLVPPGCSAFINNPTMCKGQWDGRNVVLWVLNDGIKNIMDTPDVTEPAAALAKNFMGFPVHVELKVGTAPPDVQGVIGNPQAENNTGRQQDPLEAFLEANPGVFKIVN